MSFADNFRKLPTPMIALHIGSKLILGIGIGVLLAGPLQGLGWWILILGAVLSIPPIYLIFKGSN